VPVGIFQPGPGPYIFPGLVTPTGFQVFNSAEGGADGVTVTTGNSGAGSGKAWDVVNIVGALTFSSAHASSGGLGYDLSLPAGGINYLQWTTGFPAGIKTMYGRIYYYATGTWPELTNLPFWMATAGGGDIGGLLIDSTGQLFLATGGGLTHVAGPYQLSLNTLYRFEVKLFSHASAGTVDGRIYAGHSLTPLQTLSASALNTGGSDIGGLYVYQNVSATTAHDEFVDDIGMTTENWLGPTSVDTGTGYTQSPADNVGITDSATKLTSFVRSRLDPVGITDVWTQLANHVRSRTDPENLTDSATWVFAAVRFEGDSYVDSFGDGGEAINLTDSVSYVKLTAKSQSDPIGITDSRTQLTSFVRSRLDPVGITDVVSRLANYVRSRSDAVGLTDVAAYVKLLVRSQSDPVGITDTETRLVTGARSQSDPVGITDVRTQLANHVRARTDPENLTDSATRVVAAARSQSDAVGITDVASYVYTPGGGPQTRSASDPIGITDANTRVVVTVRARSDAVGLTDSVVYLHAILRPQSDPEGITDVRTQVANHVRSRLDPVGITDVATYVLTPFVSGLGPDVFYAVGVSRWAAVGALRWAAESEERWEAVGAGRWKAKAKGRW
jgi:hypothetical protein